MPRTRTAAASTPKARKKSARPPQGWRTTDEDEIERRRQRAAGEALGMEALEPEHPVFGTFRVSSETGSSYEVEIRSLAERDNSCGCPDYEVNGLGTCKHVEAVLARVGTSRQRAKPRIEIFLRRNGERPKEFEQLQQWLACMRMICDTPYILDSECRICPKLAELREILEELLAEPGTKILVFSEWVRMLDLVRETLQEMGAGFAWHTGSVPLPRRREEVRRFKEDPECRLFLSTDSGGVGLNLQAANVVINLDLPWNPARLEQRIARAWRKHQTRPVRVLYLVTEDTIEHRMIPLLANKQRLADGVLDGRRDLSEMPLPSGRKALVERLETLTGLTGAPSAPVQAADPWEPLAGELRTELGDRLLRLKTHPGRDGREVLLVVAEDAAVERPRIEEILSRHFDGTAPPPVLELLARSAYEALARLVESGVLSFPAEGRRLLHSAPAPGPERDPQRERRLATARATFAQAERKIRMAIVLAGGGFAVEGLPALREGVELGLQARARMEGLDLLESQPVPIAWIADRLPTSLPLLDRLRAEPGTLLGATEEDVRSWIAGGETLAAEIATELRQAG
jgi:hypothetical protein